MTAVDARRKLILLSLVTTVIFSAFLIISPLFTPFSSKEALQVVQVVFPVFAGYIGAAVLFLFRGNPSIGTVADPSLLNTLIYAPFIVFWCLAAAVLFYFYLSNQPDHGQGMTFPELMTYVTLIISFMNVTTGALGAFLFQSEEIRRAEVKGQETLSTQ
jgi:drug/metabolite transporter (DMT)-like permease